MESEDLVEVHGGGAEAGLEARLGGDQSVCLFVNLFVNFAIIEMLTHLKKRTYQLTNSLTN